MINLSIIVPVYNVSKYLSKCLDSLLHQDLEENEYEIIVIDDGSTDDSGRIADEYAIKYADLIKVIHQENKGLSGARNTGIRSANGKYIQFVDSDDYLEPNVLRKLVNKMERDKLDILRFNYQNVNEQYQVFDPNKHSKKFVDYKDDVCDGVTFLNERLGYACYAVQFIIRKELLSNDENHFKMGVYFEDVEWTPRIVEQAGRITSLDLIAYNYLIRTGSITKSTSVDKKIKSINDRIYIIGQCHTRYIQNYKLVWYKVMADRMIMSTLNSVIIDFPNEYDMYVEQMRKRNYFPLNYEGQLCNDKFKIFLLNLSPILYNLFFSLLR